MEQHKAYQQIQERLKALGVPCYQAVERGKAQITTAFHAERSPGKCVESCIWFFSEVMEARTYYSEAGMEICKHSEHKDKLLRVLNYINARVFLCCADGTGGALYPPHMLYTPRFYLTEDQCFDITATTIIPYDFFELAPVETLDYLTDFCPELLDRLSIPIYGTLLGMLTPEEAICGINDEFGLSDA